MKKVIWEDASGQVRCSLLRDNDDTRYPEIGLPMEPPPLERLVVELAPELRNEFIRRGLITWEDLSRKQNEISAALNTVFLRKIIELFKLGA